MSSSIEISIPSTSIEHDSQPYTAYHISYRLPLRSRSVKKRYSEFVNLNSELKEQTGVTPPASLPAKSWFSRTVNNPDLTEKRRKELEHYLQQINSTEDPKWRNTSAWRSFLNLPPAFHSGGNGKNHMQSTTSSILRPETVITDPVVWLDCHRELKSQLHDARLNLTTRDQASTPQKQHEASAAAKSSLVKAGSMINALEEGLSNIQKSADPGWGSQKLGEGELRRRKDLIVSAKKDKDGLENLLNVMNTKAKLDHAVASISEKDNLLGPSKPRTGRVLGKETAETRELDNQGLVQLQKQKMADQDLDVDELRKIIERQKELGIAINQELEIQNEMLKMVDEDVDRVQGKIEIAKKRIGKIS